MEVVVKKSALFNLLKKTLNEDAAARSDMFLQPQNMVSFEEENPIEAQPHMGMQLSEEEPPVADPEFVPGSIRELGLASMVIMKEVPINQVEFVYRFLHKLLDMALDREEDEQGLGTKNLLEMINESARAEALIKQAATLYSQGKDYLHLISQIEDAGIDMDIDDVEDRIADMAFEMMTSQQSTETEVPDETPPKADLEIMRPSQKSAYGRDTKTIVRRRKKKEPEELELVPDDYEVEDLRYYDREKYDAADNQELFMSGYNKGADDAANDLPIADMSQQDKDYGTGYNAGYEEILQDASLGIIEFDDDSKKDLEGRLSQREKFSNNVPMVLRLIPEFFLLCQEIGYKIETDRYNLMMTGDEPKDADKNIRQVYGIAHTETFINHNLLKPYFNKDFALRSAEKHFKVIFEGLYRTPASQQFGTGFMEAIDSDGMTAEDAKNILLKVFVEKILDDVSNYNYEPDKEKRLQTLLRTEFASTTVYKTGHTAGPGGSQKASAKPYQGNTSATFHRRVKEEYREDIIDDFLDRLSTKYLSGDEYSIPSGRKDPENEKRNEKYSFDAIEFRDKAKEYANSAIDKGLADQAAVAQGKILVPEDEPEEAIAGNEDSPDGMSDEEIAEKLSNTTDFQTLAPFFGFSGAPGMRQWFLKFAKRFFEMGLISAKSGDRTLIKFHSEMVEAVLETLSEGLPELAEEIRSKASSTGGKDSDAELANVITRCEKQIQSAYQEFLDVGDDLHSIIVDASAGSRADGEKASMPFLNTLGGQLTRAVNGMFFKKILTKLDKAWTDYVSEQLQTNEQFQNHIAEKISDAAKIDPKAAKSLAEYFIGKKNAPVIVKNGSEKVYKSELDGAPTKGVKNLMKYGIDAEAYEVIKHETRDWFEDMLMTDFARELVDGDIFEGQYREMILKDYQKMQNNSSAFKKIVLTALDDIIVGSSQRQAMQSLSDYEVEK